MANKLNQYFDDVRRKYFPRWDKKREWKARAVADIHGAVARCVSNSKTIKIQQPPPDGDELALVLIHEIAHAVTTDSHGKRWIARMEKAATRAAEIGQPNIARLIAEEVARYQEPHSTGSRDEMYARIEEIVIGWPVDKPCIPFSELIDRVSGEVLLSHSDFLVNYPRARKVYHDIRTCCDVQSKKHAEIGQYHANVGFDS